MDVDKSVVIACWQEMGIRGLKGDGKNTIRLN